MKLAGRVDGGMSGCWRSMGVSVGADLGDDVGVQFMNILFETDARRRLMDFIGFSSDDVATQVPNIPHP